MQATTTSSVTLQSLAPVHATDLVACARELARAEEMSAWASPRYDAEAALRYIDRARAKRATARGEVFALVRSGRVMGCAALDDVDWIHGWAAFWLWTVPSMRGRGFGHQALVLLRQVAARRGLQRLQCLLPVSEEHSILWLRAQGACQEGLLQGRFLLEGVRQDAALLALRAG